MNLKFFKNWLFPKKINWTVASEYQQTEFGQCFKNFDDAYNFKGQCVAPKVFKVSIGGKNYYLKKYQMFKRVIPRYISFSKVKTEWENFLFFHKLGIPTANLVAYGQETRGRVVHRGVLITEELVGCQDLSMVADNFKHFLKDSDWVKEVSHQVAGVARKMHAHGFAHNDFKWRNIMVDIKSDFPAIYLIDCPSGMKWFAPFLEYRIIKDLACLDKIGKYELSRSQRMAFYKDYAQCGKLTLKDKKRIRKIILFFHDRE
ncbi:MAG: heptose kinase [Gammaproteobacteria bacterium]|nr:heptose kinase [Gammaproteobacteria bacterium]